MRLQPIEESANPSGSGSGGGAGQGSEGGGQGSGAAAVGTSAANNAAAPQSTGSVVAYTAVIGVDNSNERLRPGMTAVITLPGMTKDGVLRVPNAALSFHPPGMEPPASRAHSGTVWVLDASGKPRAVAIQTGLADERFTEVAGGDIHSGDRVITSIAVAAPGPASRWREPDGIQVIGPSFAGRTLRPRRRVSDVKLT